MIDLNDFIIKETKRKNPRYVGEMNRSKFFHCWCELCKKDRGYQSKHSYTNRPHCKKCATNQKEHKERLKKNHWSKTGKYSPKIYKTEEELLAKKERELKWSRQYGKKYYQKNKEEINEKRRVFSQNNINHRLAKNLRSRLNSAIKNNQKSGSAVSDLGCSMGEFKSYLESQFQPGMTWDNWSRDGWHIDHIVPLTAFDLTDRDQLLKACHYNNLQPMWAKDNLSKGSKIPSGIIKVTS